MRHVTVGLGILTALLATALAIPPGQAVFGLRTAIPGSALVVIPDGPGAAGENATSIRASRDARSASAAPVSAGAPSVRPLPTVRPAPGAGRSEPGPSRSASGAEPSQRDLEQIARIANILLNLPQVLSPPQAPPSHDPAQEWP
jgi:hypothetical protein